MKLKVFFVFPAFLLALIVLSGCNGRSNYPPTATPVSSDVVNSKSLQRFEDQIFTFANVKGVVPIINEKATNGLCAGVDCKFVFNGFANKPSGSDAGPGWFVAVRWGQDARAEMAIYWANNGMEIINSGAMMVWGISQTEMKELLKGGLYEVVYLPPDAVLENQDIECRLAWDTGVDGKNNISYHFPSGLMLNVSVEDAPNDFSLSSCYWVCAEKNLWYKPPITTTTTCCGGKVYTQKTIYAFGERVVTHKTNCQ